MNQDLEALIASLLSHDVEFLVVGSTVLAFYGRPRFTEDIDFWVRPTESNVARLEQALKQFGLPIHPGALEPFFTKDRQMVILGAKPQAIDLLNFLEGVDFDEAWAAKVEGELAGSKVPFLSLDHFVESKRAVGRPKDLADLAMLEEVRGLPEHGGD